MTGRVIQGFRRLGARLRPICAKDRFFIAAIIGLWVFAFSSFLFQGKAAGYDAAMFFFPDGYYLSEMAHANKDALYNPYLLCGYPKAGDPQSLYLSPINFLASHLFTIDSLARYTVLILIYPLLGACYFFLLLRGFGLARLPALLGALVVMLGGAATGRLQHSSMIVSYGLIPPVLFHFHAALRARRSLAHYAAAVFFLVCLMVNVNQVAYLGVLLIGAFCILELTLTRQGRAGRIVRLALAFLLALGLAAFLLIPVFLLISEGTRNTFDFASLKGGFNPVNLINLFFPNFFGAIRGIQTPQGTSPSRMLVGDSTSSFIYAGIVPALATLYGLVWARKDRRFIFFTVVLLLALIYAMGETTDLYKPIFLYFPGAGMFRRAVDAMFIFNLALGVLAAFSAHALLTGALRERPDRPVLIGLIFVGAVALLALLLNMAKMTQVRHILNHAVFMGLFILAASLLMFGRRAGRRGLWIFLVLMTFADLKFNNAGNLLNGHANITPPQPSGALQYVSQKLKLGEGRVEFYRCGTFGEEYAWLGYDIESIGGYNPLLLDLYAKHVGVDRDRERKGVVPLFVRDRALASLLGVKYLVTPVMMPFQNLVEYKAAYFNVYRNDAAKARVMLVDQGREVTKGFRVKFSERKIHVTLPRSMSGRVVVHNLYCKGWIARADDKPRPVMRYNGLFMSVAIQPGDKEFELAYNPWRYFMERVLAGKGEMEDSGPDAVPAAAAVKLELPPEKPKGTKGTQGT